jgi:hypothetical protein
MVVAWAVSLVTRMAMRVSVAGGMGMGVHCDKFYSTSLLVRVHP